MQVGDICLCESSGPRADAPVQMRASTPSRKAFRRRSHLGITANKQLLPKWVQETINELKPRDDLLHKAWSVILDADANHVLDEAKAAAASGSLFRKGRGRKAPETVPVPEPTDEGLDQRC
eukprot:875552-Amphidinium_carterae.1